MNFLVVFSVIVILSSSYGVQGRIGTISISKKEDLELERHLKTLNKPPIRSFQKEDGSIFDCIKVDEQPAFDHPLLRNHTIQLRPSSLPKGLLFNTDSKSDASTEHEELVDCPPRTVPIRRTTKEHLINAKSLWREYTAKFHPQASDNDIQYFATLGNVEKPSLKFSGAKGFANVYNQSVSPTQSSGAGIWLGNGSPDQAEIIHYGWTVNPRLYGDNLPRTFSYWSTNNAGGTQGCINLICLGFVQVSQDRPLGTIIRPQSVYGAKQVTQKIVINWDENTGWWVFVYRDEALNPIGYWPKRFFTSLVGSVSKVRFGGEASSPPNEPPPTMGSARFEPVPAYIAWSGYVSNIQFIDTNNALVDPADVDLVKVLDHPKCYGVSYLGFIKGAGYTMLYGGPGGQCNLDYN